MHGRTVLMVRRLIGKFHRTGVRESTVGLSDPEVQFREMPIGRAAASRPNIMVSHGRVNSLNRGLSLSWNGE
jgi:hypothetical protein